MSLLVLPIGLLVGLALGALGGGGSILTVPALVYLVGQSTQQATTSSLLIVGTASVVALIPHARRGDVRFGPGLTFGALGTAGSFAGSALSAAVPQDALLIGFAALLLLVAALMVRRSLARRSVDGAAAGADEPMLAFHPFVCACPRVATVLVTATAVGLLTGFYGVGGGFALVPALVLALSFPMPVAVGTSLVVIAVNSATALLARASSGTPVDWAVVGVFALAAITGSLVGGRLAARRPPQRLSRAFAGLLVAVAIYTAAHTLIAAA